MSRNRLEHYKTITTSAAKELQQELSLRISLTNLEAQPKLIAGADISFNRGSDRMHAAIIVLKLPGLEIVARSLVSDRTDFPYIPGYLAFRELPALFLAWQQLQIKPDVLILDGHGLAHPRKMGVATHFGIEIDHPTIGCAKNILVGDHEPLPLEKGSFAPLFHEEQQLGIALRSRTNVKPIFISPGHRLSFDDTYNIIMQTLPKYKLPETTRMAHLWANKLRRGECEAGYSEQW
ncbi:MAG TPA: deoxyribonuclease V [Balneolaceae bacterium]|nr:deoxyribonuclease V [Balneolaceae bacterium]